MSLWQKFPVFFQSFQLKWMFAVFWPTGPAWLTSSLSFFISTARSRQCLVYWHLAVFSLSTTCRRCRCFCSNCSFCSSSLLKLQQVLNIIFCSEQSSSGPTSPSWWRQSTGHTGAQCLQPAGTVSSFLSWRRWWNSTETVWSVCPGYFKMRHSTTLSSPPSGCLLAPVSAVTRRSQ